MRRWVVLVVIGLAFAGLARPAAAQFRDVQDYSVNGAGAYDCALLNGDEVAAAVLHNGSQVASWYQQIYVCTRAHGTPQVQFTSLDTRDNSHPLTATNTWKVIKTPSGPAWELDSSGDVFYGVKQHVEARWVFTGGDFVDYHVHYVVTHA